MNDKNNHGSYGPLLFDKRWKKKRKEILARDKHQCLICGETEKLEVHHRQYHWSKRRKSFVKPWEYGNKLMITLCKRCHQKGHQLYIVPIKQIN